MCSNGRARPITSPRLCGYCRVQSWQVSSSGSLFSIAAHLLGTEITRPSRRATAPSRGCCRDPAWDNNVAWENATMPLNDEVELLRHVPLFAAIPPAKLNLLAFTSDKI